MQGKGRRTSRKEEKERKEEEKLIGEATKTAQSKWYVCLAVRCGAVPRRYPGGRGLSGRSPSPPEAPHIAVKIYANDMGSSPAIAAPMLAGVDDL